MRASHPTRRSTRIAATALVGLLPLVAGLLLAPSAARAASFVPVSGAGSTWSENAIQQWAKNVNQYGLVINYSGQGSSDGRNQFKNGTVDFAVSEIPYGLTDTGVVDQPPNTRKYAYMPIVAGGTSIMYNLKIGGKRVTNLRLSGEVLTKIFTNVIKRWDDPAIKADNPGLDLPTRKIVPVVRSDGSGTTAQFTTWMSHQYQPLWDSYCQRAGRTQGGEACGQTSVYPVIPGSGFTAQSLSTGVAGYVAQSQSEGALTYVEYSYALYENFPVVKLLNAGGYYTEPTANNVAVALLKAQINNDPQSPQYLTQILDGVYNNPDPRTYPMSSYSYMIIPTSLDAPMNTDKGRSLGAFAYYFLCEGQQQAPVLGYSPLPVNLVQAGLSQVRKIPGVDAQNIDIKKCNNPTFSPDGSNTLANTAPQPSPCDRKGVSQCTVGTGGAKNTPTTVLPAAGGGATTPPTTGGTGGGSGARPPGAGVSAGQPVGGTTPLTGASGATVGNGSALVAAVPVTVASASGWDLTHTMVLLTALLLIGVILAPPLVARWLATREQA